MKNKIYYEVIVETSGKAEQQYYGEDGELALELLRVNTAECKKEIKAGITKVYMICKSRRSQNE